MKLYFPSQYLDADTWIDVLQTKLSGILQYEWQFAGKHSLRIPFENFDNEL